MVPPAATRVIAEVSVVGLACVPAALSLPFGATYSALPAGGGLVVVGGGVVGVVPPVVRSM
jgi:hypothetical protein